MSEPQAVRHLFIKTSAHLVKICFQNRCSLIVRNLISSDKKRTAVTGDPHQIWYSSTCYILVKHKLP